MEEGEEKDEEEMVRYHPRRPARIGTDVGGCFRCGGGQEWLEKMHCQMYSSEREGLWSKVRSVVNAN